MTRLLILLIAANLPFPGVSAQAGQCFTARRWLPDVQGTTKRMQSMMLLMRETQFGKVSNATLAYRIVGSPVKRELQARCEKREESFYCYRPGSAEPGMPADFLFWFHARYGDRVLVFGHAPGIRFTAPLHETRDDSGIEFIPFAHSKEHFVLKRAPGVACK